MKPKFRKDQFVSHTNLMGEDVVVRIMQVRWIDHGGGVKVRSNYEYLIRYSTLFGRQSYWTNEHDLKKLPR